VTFRRVFVLGGARSGKSAFAEGIARELGSPVVYVATATVGDEEMAERIARHRAQRDPGWRTVEVSTEVAEAIRFAIAELGQPLTLLIEDLTILLSNLMGDDEHGAEAAAIAEVDQLVRLDANVIVVSNEVGMGIVPPYPLGRRFRDTLGRLNQHAAAVCLEAYLVVAGVPLRLK
jgi:adenosylcobinamide kinase/adenosylcobinamide-phosphate guanylyltransferase